MLPAGFEPTIAASEWPQTHTLDGAGTGIGLQILNTISLTVTTITTDTAIYIATNKNSKPSEIKTNTNIDHTIASALSLLAPFTARVLWILFLSWF
jgi:hypothetical protein